MKYAPFRVCILYSLFFDFRLRCGGNRLFSRPVPFISPGRCLDLPVHLLGQAADCRTEGIGRPPSIKIEDIHEVFRFKIAVRIIGASAVKAVGNALCHCPSEGHSDVELIITFQIAPLNDVEDLPLIILPIFRRQTLGNCMKLRFHRRPLCRDIKSPLHGLHDRLPVFVLHLPELHRAGISALPGIGYIKYIPEPWELAAGIDQGNALGTALHIAPHGIIPEIIFRACRGIRTLGKDHQLLMVRVFIKPGRSS